MFYCQYVFLVNIIISGSKYNKTDLYNLNYCFAKKLRKIYVAKDNC